MKSSRSGAGAAVRVCTNLGPGATDGEEVWMQNPKGVGDLEVFAFFLVAFGGGMGHIYIYI